MGKLILKRGAEAMTRASFAKVRKRDSRGRFVECHRSDAELLFDPTRDEARPMAVFAARTGLKGLFQRVLVAFRILIWGQIPVTRRKTSIPIGIESRFISSETFAQTDPARDDEK